MDSFTDQDFKRYLNKEWLVRIDNTSSQPYLFKFHGSTDGRWTILITDTANVWFEAEEKHEALDSKQLARRWRQLNQSPEPFMDQSQESAWRAKTSNTLSSVHTLTSIQDCVFSIEDSPDADLAFELQTPDFKWRWECYSLGPKTSAKILSRHLIHPLLSVAYLAFTSAEPICELSVEDLQQVVDKVAKTGRRAHDVHVRQTVSRPRVATTLARMTAMFNFADPLPHIISGLNPQEQVVDTDAAKVHTSDRHIQPGGDPSSSTATDIQHETRRSTRVHDSSYPSVTNIAIAPAVPPIPDSVSRQKQKQDQTQTQKQKETQKEKEKQNTGATDKATPVLESSSSATEPESGSGDEDLLVTSLAGSEPQQKAGPSLQASSAPPQATVEADAASDSSQPRRPSKKAKLGATSKDSDSDTSGGEAKRRVAERHSSRPASAQRGPGVRQPIKRGGRRF